MISDAANSDVFGHSVPISADYAVVGVDHEDNRVTDCGAVYIY